MREVSGLTRPEADEVRWQGAPIGREHDRSVWRAKDVPGAEVLDARDGTVHLRGPADVDVVKLAQSASYAGRVVRLRVEPPNLSDLFREAVGG